MPTSCAARIVSGLLLISSPLTMAASAGAASDSGVITAVRGDVQVGQPSARVLVTEGFPLAEGDTVIVPGGGFCAGLTPWGESFSLDGPANLVPTASSKGALSAAQQWVSRQISVWVGESRRRYLTARAGRDWEHRRIACAPISPVNGGRVRASEARFSWITVPAVERYTVVIASADGQEERHTVLGHELIVSGLRPGAEYHWQIAPALECWPAGDDWSDFRTMSDAEEKSLGQAVKPLSDLDAGVVYLSSGLHEEAVYRFDAAAESPALRHSALRWRARALAEMGLAEEAYQDLRNASTEAPGH